VRIQGILQQLFDGMNKLNSEAKDMKEQMAKIEVRGKKTTRWTNYKPRSSERRK